MSFFLHRTGRGRERRVIARLSGNDQSQRLLIARSGEELGALLGCGAPAWFWSGKDSNTGYFGGNSTTKLIKNTGFMSGVDDIKLIDTNGVVLSSVVNESGESFAFVLVSRLVGDNTYNPGYLSTTVGSMVRLAGSYGAVRFAIYSTTTEAPSSVILANEYGRSGRISFCVCGWDARTSKPWGVFNGAKVVGPSSVTFDWLASGAMSLVKGSRGCFQVVQLAKFAGSAADYLADNSVDSQSKIGLMCKRASLLACDGSEVLYSVSDDKTIVSSSDMIDCDQSGCLVYPSAVNLLAESYYSSMWTPDGVALVPWLGFDGSSIQSLFRVVENATTAEHKTTTTVTPLATGKHWLECTIGMSTIEAIAINVNNGTNLGDTSFDATGAELGYSGDGSAQIVALGSGLFRVKLPINPATLDVCTITVRGLLLVGEDYEDTYLGATSRVAYVGQWSLVRSEAPPLAVPVSLGSAATAIAPIVDWTDAKALHRLKNGRLTADVVLSMTNWEKADLCFWSWRQDANNGVEVWARYQGTLDNRRLYSLAVVSVVAGASTETALTSGDWVLQSDYSKSLVEQLRLNLSIDSSGLVTWWARSEAGDEIHPYEMGHFTSGEDQLSGYTAPVPTSIRLGSDCDGVGQQAMTIKEVSVW